MKKFLLLSSLCVSVFITRAQTNTDTVSGTGTPAVFHYVETMPSYSGNVAEFLGANIKYPDFARENNIQGRVVVRFIVTDIGTVDSVTVSKGIGGGCDKEAIRVVKLMNKWNPGTQNGKAVNVWYNLPIIFHLEDSKKEKRRKKRQGL